VQSASTYGEVDNEFGGYGDVEADVGGYGNASSQGWAIAHNSEKTRIIVRDFVSARS
jgi:hypothetical protein